MEDFLSILIVVLIAVASAASKQKKKKKKAPDSKGPLYGTSETDKGFGEMKEFIRDMGKSVLDMDDDDEYTAPAKVKPAKLKAKPAPAKPEPAKPVSVSAPRRREASVIEKDLGISPAGSLQGRSLFEDRGCISGSIPHDTHEGESKYPYAAMEGSRREDSPVYAGEIAQELQSLNVRRLRRAIVVSEILDKPKALRRR